MKNKRVFILGLRGVPGVQGGIETHVENLAPYLVDLDYEVTVLSRKGYQPNLEENTYKGVRCRTLWSPRSRVLEAILHTFIGVLYSAFKRPDILHIHAVGPSLMVPFARLLGLQVVMTHHGPDYDRQKWGKFAKSVLMIGERLGAKYSSEVIVISKTIQDLVKKKYNVDSTLIPNGVNLPPPIKSTDVLSQYGLEKDRYILMVSRLVPEKRHFDLIKAFESAGLEDWKLVLVGNSDHPDKYSSSVFEVSKNSKCILTTGFLTGQPLKEIYTHAGFFVLPSSHEGLPIAMLEALSYGLPVIASNISANLEVRVKGVTFFELGNVTELKYLIKEYVSKLANENQRIEIQREVLSKYNWSDIANRTVNVYRLLDK